MYDVHVESAVDKALEKLSVRDRRRFLILHKKVEEIRANPIRQYKPLRAPLQGFCRVHINSHFVLIFRIDHEHRTVELWHYGHHDEVYGWRPE